MNTLLDNYKFTATIINKSRSYDGDIAYVLQVKNPAGFILGRYSPKWINASLDDVMMYTTLVNKEIQL